MDVSSNLTRNNFIISNWYCLLKSCRITIKAKKLQQNEKLVSNNVNTFSEIQKSYSFLSLNITRFCVQSEGSQ